MKRKIPVMMLIMILLMQTVLSGSLGTAQVFAEGTDAEPFQAEIELTDQEDNPISQEHRAERDAKLKLKVNWNKTQHTSDEDTYQIILPEQLDFEAVESAVLVNEENKEVGKYSLKDGFLSFQFTNEEQEPAKGTIEVPFSSNQAVQESKEEQVELTFAVGSNVQLVPFYLTVPAETEQTPAEPAADEEQTEEAPADDASAEKPAEQEQASEEKAPDEPIDGELAAEDKAAEEQPADQEQEVKDPAKDKAGEEKTDEITEAEKEDTEEKKTEEEAAPEVAERQTGEIEENIITSIVMKDEKGDIIDADENPENQPTLGEAVTIDMEWALQNGHPYGEGSTFTFNLPDYFKLYNDVKGELAFGNDSVGSYVMKMDGTVVMTFNDNISKLSNVKGTLHLWTEFKEEIVGSVEQEIVFTIKEEAIDIIPIRFTPKTEIAIDKAGKTDRGYNAKEITWTVDFNKKLATIEDAVLHDPLQENLQLQPGSINVYKLDVQLDGTVKQGELVDPSNYQVQEEPFSISFGQLKDAYRVEFTTDITDADGRNYSNTATLTGSNLEKDLSAKASVNVRRGEPLKKTNAHYDEKKQIITWEIEYNYNEKAIKQQDAVLTDLFDDSHVLLDNIIVERITIGENGEEVSAAEVKNYHIDELTAKDGKRGFQLQFDENIQNAYKITYQTKAEGRVLEDGRINNTVTTGEYEKGAGGDIKQQVLSKFSSNVNYQKKTSDWTIDFNKDSHEMKNVVITDTYPNKGLTMKEDTFKIINIDGNKEVSRDEYELTVTPDGFTVEFKNQINTPHKITYSTDFNYDSLTEHKVFKNNVQLDWTDEWEKEQTKEASAEFYPDEYTKNNGFKNGSYNAVTKEITWNVGVNYDLKDLKNITVTDYIQGQQQLVEDSIKVYDTQLMGWWNGVNKGELLAEGKDYTVEKVTNAKGEPGFKVKILKDNSKPYWIEYKTSLAGELIVNRYNNTATLDSDDLESINLDAHVSVNNGGSYNVKNGSQNGNAINWRIDINKGQSHVTEAKVTDELRADQILLEDSFKLYATNVDGRGNLSKGEEVPKGDYKLDIQTADDGSQTFVLSFLEDIDRAYILEYQSYINAANGQEVSNKAVFSGKNITTETVESSKTIIVKRSGGSGSGSGEYGSLEVSKVDAATGDPLAGATFTLYDSAGEIAIRSVTTGEDGKAVFKNLLYDNYLLKEVKAPEGYVVGIQDTKKVTVEGESKVTIENKEITRYAQITKKDAETGKPIAGAVFELQQQIDGEWKQSQKDLTTNEDGIISVKDLDAGNYRWVETEAPELYELNADPVYFNIQDNQTWVTEVTKDNAIKRGSVKLQKMDQAGDPLQGAVFAVKDADGNPVREGITSDENGLVEVKDLRPGTYTIVETKAPEFYQLDQTEHKFTIDPNKEAQVDLGTIENKLITGSIKLTKVDADQKESLLEGAVFELRTADGETLREGLTTNAAGVLLVDQLAPGNYQLVETAAPNGYQVDAAPIQFTIEKSNEEKIQVEREISNKLTPGEVILTKVDDKDGTVLAEAEFALYHENGDLVKEGLKTDADGKLTVADLHPGKYYFQETKAPANYELNEEKLPFTIERGQLAAEEVTATNTLTPGAVSLVKTDENDDSVKLAGAEFKLLDAKGDVVKEKLITNEAGQIVVEDLAPGTYTFVETKASEHYQLDDTPIEVTVEKGQKAAAVVTATNVLIPGSVVLEKVDSADHNIKLEGAVFQLVNSKGDVIEKELKTGNDGRIVVENLKPGNYQFIEVTAPKDYELDKEPINFTVDKSQKEALVIQQTNTLTPGSAELKKVNKHNSEEALAGAVYVLKDAAGTIVRDNLITDEDGKIAVKDLAPGTYQFEEVKAPKHFVLDSTPITVEVARSQEKTVAVTATNELKRGAAEIKKVGEDDTAKGLEGAEYELRTTDGVTVESGKTDETGTLRFNNLLPGEYVIVETKAPFGYDVDSTPIPVTVERSQKETVTKQQVDKLSTGSIVLKKVDSEENTIGLTGAEFTLQDDNEKVLQTGLTTNEAGELAITHLKPGDYQLVETKAPADYVLNDTPIIFTIEKGQQVISTVEVENTLTPGAVSLIKVDKDNEGVPLQGAEYKLVDAAGTTIQEKLVTDLDGRIIVSNLAPGKYQFIETKAPENYVLDETPIDVEVTRSQEEAAIVRAENELIPGSVALEKKDSVDESITLAGAAFKLVDSKGNTIEEKLSTDENGRIVVEDLKPGAYQFIETKAPADYALNEKPIDFEISKNQQEKLVVSAANKLIPGSVELTKINTHDRAEKLAGAVFELQDQDGKVMQADLKTDESGSMTVDNLAPGNYQFVETAAPTDFVTDQTPIRFVIERSQQEKVTLTAENDLKKGSLEIVKLDSVDEKLGLEGASFDLLTAEGDKVASGTTDKEGKLVFKDLVPGSYFIKETKAPFGYDLDPAAKPVTIERSQQETAVVQLQNELSTGAVQLKKVDSADNNIMLSNAVFRLQDSNGDTLQEGLTTNGDGLLTITDLKPGNYQLIETSAPENYVLDNTPIAITIEKGQQTALPVTAENTLQPGIVSLIKVDKDNPETHLENAQFKLLDEKGNTVKEQLHTDGEGRIIVEDLAPGSYTFVETKAPAGYELDDTAISVTVEKGQKEAAVVTAVNELTTGSVALEKIDADNNEVKLEGAVFKLVNAEGDAVKEQLVTDENGQITVEDLKPGNYQFIETKAPAGYDLDASPINVTVDKGQQETAVVTAENLLTPGSVKLEKVDADNNTEKLAGAVFQLVNDKGDAVKEQLVTDENGEITVEGLKPGNYQFIETKAPAGYDLDETPINVTVAKGQQETAIVTAENQLTPGSVALEKVDADDNTVKLAGAVFKLVNDKGDAVKEKLVTDKNGQITVDGLKPGNYQFIETKAPAGYDLDETPINVTVAKGQQETAVVTAKNKLTPGTAVLEKVDADDASILLEGAVFKLVNEKGDMVRENLTTDETGRVTVDDLKPGNYQFIETKAPAGYQLNEAPIDVTVEKNQQEAAVVTAVNELTPGAVILEKVDAANNKVTLEGAVFKLVDSKGNTIHENLVTEANGRIIVEDLKPGNYQFIETKAPAGYDLNETPIDVTVEKAQKEAAVVTAGNELTTGTAVLEKVDADNDAIKLAGAVFKLVNEQGDTVKEKITTEANGRITVEGLKPGNYQFVETKAPTGYNLNETPIDVTIEKGQQAAAVVTAVNELTPGSIVLEKVDTDDASIVLAGAAFKLVDSKGNAVKEELVTDANGRITVKDLKPGSYQFIETKAPAGYELNDTPIDVTVEKDQQEAAVVTAVNELTPGSVVLEKVDAEDRSILLEGAAFKLVNAQGDTVKEALTTDRNGRITVDGLKPGTYQFIETKAPVGYELNAAPIQVTVEKGQQETAVVTAENELTRGSIVLTKADADNSSLLLEGAVFKLVNDQGDTVKEELVTNDAGQILIDDLKPGTYQLIETKAPAGYNLDATPINVTVEKGQQDAVAVTAVNELTRGSIVLEKADAADSSNLLEGAEFNLVDTAGNIVKEELVTDANGQIIVEDLKPGTYQFIETKAPTGYELDSTPIDVTVEKGQTEPVVVTAVNEQTPGTVMLEKVDAEVNTKHLEGAVFSLFDEKGNAVKEDLVTDKEGRITVEGLQPGDYQFVETKAPAGYQLDNTPIVFTIEIAQQTPVIVTAVNTIEPTPEKPEEPTEQPEQPEQPTDGETPSEPEKPTNGETPTEPETPTNTGTVTENPKSGSSVTPAAAITPSNGTNARPAATNQQGLPASLPQTGEQLLSMLWMAGILSVGIGGTFIWNAFRTQTARKRK
ncbi:SpaA isopeptide-forming pilin-related protein [Terribacillus halophilus]|uniref:SpaA isopeptide-forming pilin-related protein n=1 Tax=Terribacillus halophilus TaxID=361279 RepID=UPI00098454B1|nr:SpaA isopeptide-forming pilin-related protein [Terribacillus halophilus]